MYSIVFQDTLGTNIMTLGGEESTACVFRFPQPMTLGVAPDGSRIVAVKGGGTKLPPIFLSAGAHSTEQVRH